MAQSIVCGYDYKIPGPGLGFRGVQAIWNYDPKPNFLNLQSRGASCIDWKDKLFVLAFAEGARVRSGSKWAWWRMWWLSIRYDGDVHGSEYRLGPTPRV